MFFALALLTRNKSHENSTYRLDNGIGLRRRIGQTLRSAITSRGSESYDMEGTQRLGSGHVPEEGVHTSALHWLFVGRHKDL